MAIIYLEWRVKKWACQVEKGHVWMIEIQIALLKCGINQQGIETQINGICFILLMYLPAQIGHMFGKSG